MPPLAGALPAPRGRAGRRGRAVSRRDRRRVPHTLDRRASIPSAAPGGRRPAPAGVAVANGAVEFLLNGALEISASEPPADAVPLAWRRPPSSATTPAPVGPSTPQGKLQRYRVRLPEGGGKRPPHLRRAVRLRPRTQKEEYKRGFRDTAGIVSPRGRLPRRERLLVSAVRQPASSSSSSFAPAPPDGWHLVAPGQRHLARRERPARSGSRTARSTRSTSSVARSSCYRDSGAAPIAGARVYLRQKDDGARREVPRGDGAVPRDVRRPDRPLPLRQVRARRELLGDRLRHAVLHAARAAGDPLPVHPDLVLPARDPAQLVGQLGLRRLRERQLVRGADRLHGRPPDPGAARAGRGLPARHAAEVRELRARTAATSRSASSARATAPRPRRSATARR